MSSSFSVMGIINLSENSFYNAFSNDEALKRAEQMAREGASYIDVGAIATNPQINLQHQTPSEQQELDCLISFIERCANAIDVKISVDTYRPRVMKEAVAAGAHMINDQHALMEENALETASTLNVPICLMHHSLNWPAWRNEIVAHSVLDGCEKLFKKIMRELAQFAARCLSVGIKKENVIIDPGFGCGHFGKTPRENFYVLEQLSRLTQLEFPLLVGLSRKSMFGGSVDSRLSASIDAAVYAVSQGASIVRVHDVAETVAAAKRSASR